MSIFLGEGNYQYSTYDMITNNPSLQSNIPFKVIEGNWVYLYMGYKRNEKKVINYALFSDGLNLQN